jgi:hypothetical protein
MNGPEYVQFPRLCTKSLPLWITAEQRQRRRDRAARWVIAICVGVLLIAWMTS